MHCYVFPVVKYWRERRQVLTSTPQRRHTQNKANRTAKRVSGQISKAEAEKSGYGQTNVIVRLVHDSV